MCVDEEIYKCPLKIIIDNYEIYENDKFVKESTRQLIYDHEGVVLILEI